MKLKHNNGMLIGRLVKCGNSYRLEVAGPLNGNPCAKLHGRVYIDLDKVLDDVSGLVDNPVVVE